MGGAIPYNDSFETGFTSRERNIFRQAFQKRADVSLVKVIRVDEKRSFKYTLDVFNLTNTTSFDLPGADVSQNDGYNGFPVLGTAAAPVGCTTTGDQTNTSFYNCPNGLGVVSSTIGSPRQVQMSLQLVF
jgi:hypothetical protein